MVIVSTKIPQNPSHIDRILTDYHKKSIKLFKIHKTLKALHLADKFGLSREHVYRIVIRPLLDAEIIKTVNDTKGFYQLTESQIEKSDMVKESHSESEIFKTKLFKNWARRNHTKLESRNQTRFARIVLGFVNPKFKIHPDDITKENWKEIILNMVDALLKVANYEIINNEPNWSTRQAIRHAIKYGLGIEISKDEGIELRISGEKPKAKSADLHITPEQITHAKKLLLKNYSIEDYLKFGVKTWTFVRPSTIHLIELENMHFLDQVVEYVKGADDEKLTDEKVVVYAKFKGEKTYSYVRRICHIKIHENKTHTDFDKYILDSEFVEPLEKFYNNRVSQRKKYLFWENNNTKFEFKTYDSIVKSQVGRDNKFFKKILSLICFKKSDFGVHFRANYGFRHFGIQMWLIATDYNYDLVSEMSHEDTATLKKWYGKRTQEQFQKKISGIMV